MLWMKGIRNEKQGVIIQYLISYALYLMRK